MLRTTQPTFRPQSSMGSLEESSRTLIHSTPLALEAHISPRTRWTPWDQLWMIWLPFESNFLLKTSSLNQFLYHFNFIQDKSWTSESLIAFSSLLFEIFPREIPGRIKWGQSEWHGRMGIKYRWSRTWIPICNLNLIDELCSNQIKASHFSNG